MEEIIRYFSVALRSESGFSWGGTDRTPITDDGGEEPSDRSDRMTLSLVTRIHLSSSHLQPNHRKIRFNQVADEPDD